MAATRAVPVIMISTEAETSDREKAYLAGANFYLVKPARPDEIRSAALLMTGRVPS